MPPFIKRDTELHIAFEAAGLRDLADQGAPVAELLWVKETSLATAHITSARPSAEHARQFGRDLAALHRHGSDRVFGQAPPTYDLATYKVGAMGGERMPLVAAGAPARPWGEFYAEDRLLPYLEPSLDHGAFGVEGARVIEALAERLRDGVFDTDDEPSILHGDLWSGNVMWSPDGAILIDPQCHTGHRESDLAQLTVFGIPYHEEILAGYREVFPLSPGWRQRDPLHQLHMLIVHCALFGAGYGPQTIRIARSYL
ncbi:MAG: fructosamine kinase family protein [Flaviflexus sp.]|nr:fructosamine kinase family protein [Flaviflexus sp.]